MSEKLQTLNQLNDDLKYVKNAVKRREDSVSRCLSIPMLWAGINLIGWGLYDYSAGVAGTFWLIAVPLGMVLSFILGYRYARVHGDLDARQVRQNLWHWMMIPVAALALGFVLGPQQVPQTVMLQCILLVIGLVYLLGGVHLDRTFLPGGIVLVGSVFLVGLVPYTVVGALVAVGLVAGVIDAVWRTKA